MVAQPDFEPDPTPTTVRLSVRLPSDLVERLRQRAGPQGLSRYVADILDRADKRAGMVEWLEEMAEKHGPLDDAEVAAVMRRWFREGLHRE